MEFSQRDSPRDFAEVASVSEWYSRLRRLTTACSLPLPAWWRTPTPSRSPALPDDGLHMENISIKGGAEAKYIKIRINSGHGEFAAVYNVSAF